MHYFTNQAFWISTSLRDKVSPCRPLSPWQGANDNKATRAFTIVQKVVPTVQKVFSFKQKVFPVVEKVLPVVQKVFPIILKVFPIV